MGDSTIGYPEPPGYEADIVVNPDTVGDPLRPSQFAAPLGASSPPSATGGQVDVRARKHDLRMSKRLTLTQGTAFGEDLGFNARSLIVDNNTGQWLYDAASRRYIPPGCFGAVLQFPSGSQIGALTWTAPPGVTQPAGVVGSQAVVIYTEDFLDPSAGVISGSGTGQPTGVVAVTGTSIISGASGAFAAGPVIPTAANVLDGFATVSATTTTTLVTVPAGRTWLGYVGVSAATTTAAAATTTATVASAIAVANGTGTAAAPVAGTYTRTDAIAAANAAGGTVGNAAASAVDGQRLLVQAPAGGTVLIQHVATIANGTSPQASGWALGELL